MQKKSSKLFSVVLSTILVLCLCLSLMPNSAMSVEAASTGLSLSQLRQKFPHGKYWNHAGNPGSSNSVNNQNGYTSTPCSQHGVVGTSKQTCNGFQPSGTQLSWQCMGYAEKLGYDATGYNPRNNANGWYTYTSSSALDNLKPGDIVRYNGHSIYVIGVNGDSVIYTDCNSDGHCKIRWDVTISKSTLRSSFTYVRSAPSSVSPGTTSCSCSTSYAGNYVCVTSSLNLNIRNGHGTSYAIVGSIPSGATVYISKATGTGSNDWGHVTYNGVTGYVSMQYMQKQGTNHAETPTIRWWLSDSEYGEAISDFNVGNRYYFCYRLYDSVTGKDWDEVSSNNYTVNIAIYNPDGSLNYDNTRSSDSGWISIFYTTAGTYTRKVVVAGDFLFEGSREFYVAPNPKEIHSSESSVSLTLGGTSTAEIFAWTSGYHSNSTVLSWSRSNDNVSCSWGEWNDDDLLPLYITANFPGTTTITLSVKDKDTSAVLHSIPITVTVNSKSYQISYNANGGSGAPGNQTKYYNTTLTLSSTKPTKTGYTFLGWSTSSTATSATYQPGGSFTSNANTILYAVWKANTTALSVNSTNSAVISTGGEVKYFTYTPTTSGKYVIYSTCSDDTKVYLYNASGHELDGDDDDGDGNNFRLEYNLTAGTTYTYGVRYYNSSKTGTISFKFGNVYTVTYNANGGSGAPSSQSKDYGTDITLRSTAPTRTGYTFLGWSTSSTVSSATYQSGSSFSNNANTTLYAVWKASTYTVSYNANGGSGAPSSQTKIHGVKLILSSTKPTRAGYTFLGWSTSSTVTSVGYQPGGSFTGNANTTLYAVWKQGCENGTHSYSYTVTKTPTTSATGTLIGTCSNCSRTTTVFLPKLSTTDYSYSIKTAATCTASGTGLYTWKTKTYGSFYFDAYISATGHTYTNNTIAPTCTAKGYTTYTCVCGDTYKCDYTAELGHSYNKTVTAPTCTSTGYTHYDCSRCSKEYYADYTDMVGHKWDSGEIIKEPTVDEKGVKSYSCKTCKLTRKEDIEKLDFVIGDVDSDGKVTAADARLSLRCSVGLENYSKSSKQFSACDADSDGKVTASDARKILRFSVGLEKIL